VTNIDSINKPEHYVDYAKFLGMVAMAFSEHGNVMGWKHKKDIIENAGMKYIHACEFYLTEDDIKEDKHRDNYHCVLIAKNYDGVKELNLLSSQSFNRDDWHFYYMPRISVRDLYNTSDNIIITSACLASVFNRGNIELQKEMLNFFVQNRQRCYLEIQHHNCEDQIAYNKKLYTIHQRTGIPLIAGTDTHALNDIYAQGRKVLQKAKDVFFADEDNWDLTFKTYDELVHAYEIQNAIPKEAYLEAINNTNIMAEQIEEFQLDYTPKYPKLYKDSEKVFKQKIAQGLKDRNINSSLPNYQEYKDRIAYEYNTYKHNGAIDFMLLEENYKSEMRRQGIEYGYSRGSVSGSIIAYLLHITEVDSIQHHLNYERFMNKERVSLADVDTDFYSADRKFVKDYLYNKHGLFCCDIITFNTVKLKGAIREIGRAMNISLDEVDDICNNLEDKEEELRKQYKELFYWADLVTNVVVSVGFHPAGVVVSPFPIDDYFGTFTTTTDEYRIAQLNMKEIDSLNFVKLDILALDNIGLINQTCKLAGIDRLTPQTVKDDINVWNSIRDDTTLIFQFESNFASDYIKELFSDKTINKIKKRNPNFSYIDLMSVANGALRPAGESYRDALKQGDVRDNGHEALNNMLASTSGFLVYQEQVIQFLHEFCGYTMGEADIVRRHFAKKTGTDEDIPKIRDGFIKTMKEKYNTSQEEAERIIVDFLRVIEDASNYLFSLNHALPYSYIGYICGYLRYYYPLEFLTSALNIFENKADDTARIIAYAKKNGIEIKGIKFGKSESKYTMDKENNCIYKGIASIKYCNNDIATELFELSQRKKYNNFIDLLKDIYAYTSLNSRQLNILIGLNFFSEFGKNKYLINIVDIYNKFGTCKIINKNNLEEFNNQYGLTELMLDKYCGKSTAKQYREIDNEGLIKALCEKLENKSLSISEQIKFEDEMLGYIDYVNPKVPEYFWIVTEFKVYNNSSKPYLTLRNIHSGETVKTKIKKANIFNANPFELYSILIFNNFSYENKSRKVDGKWIKIDEKEPVLNVYEVLKGCE
jgi:DNA polymerase-3 subunit alpha